MPRYFLNTSTVAGRPVICGGFAFEFEPVSLRAGSWLGLLEVADDAQAGALAACGNPNIDEITKEKFDSEKKNLSGGGMSLSRSRSSAPFAPAVADRAGRVTSPTFDNNGGPNSTSNITAVTVLQTTRRSPPADPTLNPGARPGQPW